MTNATLMRNGFEELSIIGYTCDDLFFQQTLQENALLGMLEIAERTEDVVGPYELHDFFLYHFIRYGATPQRILDMAILAFAGFYNETIIKHWPSVFIHRFFAQQFKRSCMTDGPKVGNVSLSPRGDWRMPSDACSKLWLDKI